MTETLADRLAEFSLATRFEDLPEMVVVEARRRLLDAFGCAAGALDEPAPTIARRAARAVRSEPGSSLFGGGRSSPDWAAFANGVHIRYLDCNDTYLSLEPAHPSDNWAAVMAVGEHVGADGRAWIAAAAVAYEVQCRLADAASIRARGWDHVTYGALSTSLAASKLLGARPRPDRPRPGDRRDDLGGPPADPGGRTVDVEGVCLRPCRPQRRLRRDPGPRGDDRTVPPVRGGHGVLAAGLRAVRGRPARRARRPSDWMLPKTSIKFVPAEYHSQSAIAAAFELRPKIGDPSRIRSIEIATFRVAVEIIGQDPEKWRPRTRETADHSLPYCTAVALVDGAVSADQFPRTG